MSHFCKLSNYKPNVIDMFLPSTRHKDGMHNHHIVAEPPDSIVLN